jgi:hypothetical protein
VLVAVPREEDVKFLRLCEGRNYPVARIGVTDAGAEGQGAVVEVQDLFTVTLEELRTASRAPMVEHFGAVVGYAADLSGSGIHRAQSEAPRGGRISE